MSQDVISFAFVFRQATNHCYSSLAFLIYDWLLNLESEVQHIWMQPQKRVFRWLYIYFRYFSMLIQAIHPGIIEYLAGGHGSRSSCLAWKIYASLVGQVNITAVEMLLAVRVYALFNRSRRIAFLVGFHILVDVISSVVNAVYTIRATKYHKHCISSKPPHQLMYHSIIVLSTQVTLMGLTLLKTVLSRRSGWGRTPIVSLLLRDSSAVLFVISALCLLSIGLCQLNDERPAVMFFWSVSILPSCGCWLLMNTQQLIAHCPTRKESSASIRAPVLSTLIEIE
ncbi:hypothetical protein BDR05DRAFT_968593 [Suillus weaverae]|nr:hypothetical protein BDR05DRAFT_968593 [Suillus weaverae]